MPKKPLAVVDLVPYWIKKRMESPDWFDLMDEGELREECKPDAILWQLRIRLWSLIEVNLQQQAGGVEIAPIPEADFYRDICTKSMFDSRLRHDTKGWFVCRPIHDFNDQLDALLTIGTARMWEIMNLPIHTKTLKGKKVLDVKAARLVMDAFKLMKDTKVGGPVQRILSASVTPSENPTPNSPKLLEDEIKELEARVKHGKVVDVGDFSQG